MLKNAHFGLFGGGGGPGWPINNPTGLHLASQASSHLYQSTYKIWKQSDKEFLSYRENDEVSADADAAADAAADADAA